MAKEAAPERIVILPERMDALKAKVRELLPAEDALLIEKIMAGYFWITHKFQQASTTMHKLRKLFFGAKTEKKKKQQLPAEETDQSDTVTSTENEKPANDPVLPAEAAEPGKPVPKGHGRTGADAYHADEIIRIPHLLKAGDPCPLLCKGKVYPYYLGPAIVIRVIGQPCAHIKRYEFGRMRCSLCSAVFTAEMPADFSPRKYDFYFRSILVVQKYFMAMPFYRQEQYYKLQGIPLSDATQWDLVESAADCVYPVFGILEKLAANGTNINNDDTRVRILDVMRDNNMHPDKKRTGMFTSCLLAEAGTNKICLYYSGVKHSGENLTAVLKHRDSSLPLILQMCDALSANMPAALKSILCNCLIHGRRKFTDIEEIFPAECGHVISELAFVYKTDAETKEKNMTPDERLAHHKAHSLPVMDRLKVWMQEQIDLRKVEPNSALGGAIGYMQRHWEKLTRFLSVAGAHLDNNVVERALKLAIRTRKAAMFHKSEHGAFVAALFFSLIATCAIARKNPVHYLTALQAHKKSVFGQPEQWLPWNYELMLKEEVHSAA